MKAKSRRAAFLAETEYLSTQIAAVSKEKGCCTPEDLGVPEKRKELWPLAYALATVTLMQPVKVSCEK